MNWARVPAWLGGRLTGDRVASEIEAWSDLLCRWHQGEDPGPRVLMRAWKWGAGRTSAFTVKAADWARENGARLPDRIESTGTNRNASGTLAGHSEAQQTPDNRESRDSSGTVAERIGTPHARALLVREQTDERREINQDAPAPADAPIAAHPEASPREQPPEAATAPTTLPDPRPAPSIALVAPAQRGNGATSTALATRKTEKPKVWGYAEAIKAWGDEHERILGTEYPWQWKGHKADPPRVKVWLDTARVTEHDLDGGIARIRTAVRAYLGAVDAGTAWPIGDPASTHHFTREIAKWLQITPGSRPAPGASRAPTKTESLLRHIQKRLQESTNAE